MLAIGISIMVMTRLTSGMPDGSNRPSYGFPFYTKSDWEAQPATQVEPLNTPVPYVVIHHTYIPGACNTTEQCKAAMRSMQRYHQSLDWGDIGYNFCVGGEGAAYQGRGWEVRGIHAGKANGYSVGICLIGDFKTELPPQRQLLTTQKLIKEGVARGIISPDYKVVGHKQVMSTECPGGALYAYIQTWNHYAPDFIIPDIAGSPLVMTPQKL